MKQITEYKVENLNGNLDGRKKIITGDFLGSAGHFEVKLNGEGYSETCEITLTGGLFDQDGPATIKIYGQWEFDEFTELIKLINRVG